MVKVRSDHPAPRTKEDLLRLGFHLRQVRGADGYHRTEWHREQAMNPSDYDCEFCRNRHWGTPAMMLATAETCAAAFIDKPVLDWAVKGG